MKYWDVSAFFPQAPAARADQRERVKAGTMHVALYRAIRDMRASKLRGRRLREARIHIRQLNQNW